MEEIMQYMWQWRLYGDSDRELTDGRPVRILHPGQLNTGSGPDFFNARVVYDGTEWAGNVELHIKASDWHRHGHDSDRSYDSVILHVVGEDDDTVCRTDGSTIAQTVISFDVDTAEIFGTLSRNAPPIRCGAWLENVPPVYLIDWIERAGMERVHEKSNRLAHEVELACGEWNKALFVIIARALGFGVNGEPFERLARSLPLNVIARHSDSLFQLEALLLGCAGLLEKLPDKVKDSYFGKLRDEFSFLQHKYSLHSLERSVWKMRGNRPGNMPHRKLALLARILQHIQTLFSSILEAKGDTERLAELFSFEFEGYWASHFTFGEATNRVYKKAISDDMIRVMLINVVAPLYHAFGIYKGDTELEESAERLLRSLPAENNAVVRMWGKLAGFTPRNAFESQALLYAKHNYCDRSECLHCRLGHKLLRITATGKK